MTDDLVKQIDECRDYLHENAPGILDGAADRIEILEEALRNIANLNCTRDRFSDEIDKVILTALKGK